MTNSGLGPWETALRKAKDVAEASGAVTTEQTDSWAVKVDESGLGFWGSYASGEFVSFVPVGTPDGFVRLANILYG